MIRQSQAGLNCGFWGHALNYRGKSCESHLKSITQYLIVQYGLSSSGLQQKHLELENCASHYQNIAKLMIHPSNWIDQHLVEDYKKPLLERNQWYDRKQNSKW